MNAAQLVVSLGLLAFAPVSHAIAQEELGPLANAVSSQLLVGWKGGSQDGWFVLRNDAEAGSEQTLMLNAGPPPKEGRTTSVNVSLTSNIADAAIGILVRHVTKDDLCLMEITAEATANLFCLVDGKRQSIASVAKAAKMDGSDVIEMFEVPGAARFLLNGTVIGDVDAASALGGEVGIMAYERGTFGIADFSIADAAVEAPSAPAGSGLPPKGGATGATTPSASPTDSGGSTDAATRMAGIMGPLADTIYSSADKDGWKIAFEGNWVVFINADKASSELYFTVPVGPLKQGERVTRLDVGILPPDGKKAEDFGKSATGILVEGGDGASCVGEITGARDGLVICFNADGSSDEIARVAGAAIGDGSDVLELVERPGSGEFRLNGKVIGQLGNHPALGGDIGVLAYERGDFYLGGFSISSDGAGAAKPPVSSPVSSDSSGTKGGPLPTFGHEEARLIGVYLGLANGIFMHEFGHALIGELQVPSTGPEEDAVDIFSALRVVEPTMYPSGDADIDAIGREVAIYSALPWYYGGLISEASGGSTPWQDEHTGDLKRFRNVFCVIYGGNPGLYANVAKMVGLDERTLSRCEEEFNRQNRAWRTILAPHTRVGAWHPEGLLPAGAPGAKIEVIFEPSQSRVGEFLATAFSESITGFADDLAETYALPRGLTVTYKDCGELNAWYSPREGTITMCYDLIEHLAVMISDIEMGTKNGIETGDTSSAPASGAASQQTTTSASADAARADIAALGAKANVSDELVDLGIPMTRVLFPAPYLGPTPTEHIRASLLTTSDLAKMIGNKEPMVLIDTSGKADTIPGAFTVTDAGKDGSLTDNFQSAVDSWLKEETSGDKTLPIVFFGSSVQDRSSYNAALRAGTLGWNAYWYRGGAEAWRANGLPLVPQD